MKTQAITVNRSLGSKYKPRDRKSKTKELNITSLLDILTILLVFMIKNVSMDSTQKDVPEGMLLPSTVSKSELVEKGKAVIIKLFAAKENQAGEIVESKILVGKDNLFFGTLEDINVNAKKKQELKGYLKIEADETRKLDGIPCILIQADKDVKCGYITQLIQIGAEASFSHIYFSSIKASENEALLGTTAGL